MYENSFLNRYLEFVDNVTSEMSKDVEKFNERVEYLQEKGYNAPRLLTAAIGLSDESGEFSGLVKKILFHGKDLNRENLNNLKSELGDIMWYWANACISLGFDPVDVIENNVHKLKKRYPEGFSVFRSENRIV